MSKKYAHVDFFGERDDFSVISQGNTNITRNGAGKSRWIFVVAVKESNRTFNFLIIGKNIWGLNSDLGFKLKSQEKSQGRPKIKRYLTTQFNLILQNPEKWEKIDFFN
jgi:hypothetical protein